ncbi:protein of unknown function (DUF4157), partial [Candidatus Methanomarinus sp.]
PGYSQSMSSPTDRILFLQRTIGNQAMQRLIKSGALQTKLRISQSGDKYEQEADLIADTVLQMPKPKAVDHSDGEPSIQRICLESEKEELRRQPIEDKEREKIVQPKLKIDREHIQLQAEEEEEEELLQTKEISDQNTEITPDLDSHIQALSGGGKPLPESVHSFFESRFGYDFNHVRLHTDKPAADVTRAVNNYTSNHIPFFDNEVFQYFFNCNVFKVFKLFKYILFYCFIANVFKIIRIFLKKCIYNFFY